MPRTHKDNFCCAIFFFVDILAKILRRYFIVKIENDDSNNTLDTFLFANQKTILNLHQQKVLSKTQKDLIFPFADVSKWDITLLVCLIRNLFNVDADGKTSLDEVKGLRNKVFAHAEEASLDNTVFDDVWNKLTTESYLFLNEIEDDDFTKIMLLEIKALKQKAYMHDLNMQLEENKSHPNYPAQNNGNRAHHGRQEASHGHQSDGVRVLVCSFN